MIVAFTCQCGERISLYATPGAMQRCRRCRRACRMTGDDMWLQARQELDMELRCSAPGYSGSVTL